MIKKLQHQIRNKKASHVGIVLSFVIFVTFLIFLYTIIEPATRIESGKQRTLELLVPALMQALEEDMTTVTVRVEDLASSSGCVEIAAIAGLNGDLGVVGQNESEAILPSWFDKNRGITQINLEGVSQLFKIYYSKELPRGHPIGTCTPIFKGTDNQYTFGLIRTNGYIFESKINVVIDSMVNRDYYEEFKNNLSIPLGDEFGFGFKNNTGGLVETSEKEGSISIYVEEIPIQYVDEEANIKPGFLIIKVW